MKLMAKNHGDKEAKQPLVFIPCFEKYYRNTTVGQTNSIFEIYMVTFPSKKYIKLTKVIY